MTIYHTLFLKFIQLYSIQYQLGRDPSAYHRFPMQIMEYRPNASLL